MHDLQLIRKKKSKIFHIHRSIGNYIIQFEYSNKNNISSCFNYNFQIDIIEN